MALGAVGLWQESVPLLFAALFCLGTHSTVFGPIKYALLPQHLRADELVAGNALIEAGTFLAILLGTILGGSVVLLANGALDRGRLRRRQRARGMARRASDPAGAVRRLAVDAPRPRLLRDTIAVVGHVDVATGRLLLPILAVSWFWLFGATVVSGLPSFAKDVLFANEQVVTMMLALFAVGVGVGSMLAERLLHGEVSARLRAGRGAVRWRSSPVDLHLGQQSAACRPARTGDRRRRSCAQPGSWRILADLVGLAMAGGLFTVPLYAILQHESEPAHRARVIAANNIINALAMSIAAVGAAAFLARGMTMGELFALCGLATHPGGVRSRRGSCGARSRRAWCDSSCDCSYRVRVEGLEHARAALPQAVIAANHASFLDGLLLGAFLPGDPIFAVDTLIAKQWWAKPFLVFVNALPVDPTNPLSIRAMIRAVEAGSACIIFPEGRITTTGSSDEGVRRAGGHRRADEGRAAARAHRRRRVHAVLAAGGQGSAAPVSADSHPHPAAARADGARGRDRPRASRRAAPRAPRRDGAVDVRRRARSIRRCSTRCSRRAQQHGGGHLIADDLEMRPLSYRGLDHRPAMRSAVVLAQRHASGRARRCAAADVARLARHVLRAAG